MCNASINFACGYTKIIDWLLSSFSIDLADGVSCADSIGSIDSIGFADSDNPVNSISSANSISFADNIGSGSSVLKTISSKIILLENSQFAGLYSGKSGIDVMT